MLIYKKFNLSFHLSHEFFNKKEIIDLIPNIIDQSFFRQEDKKYINKNINKKSNWAFDLRIPLSNINYTKILYPEIGRYLNEFDCKTLAFKGYGSFPLISISNFTNANNILIIREEHKKYGFQNIIEGNANKNDPVCIIDDLYNSGNSKRNIMLILKEHGFETNLIFSFLYFQKKQSIKTDKMLSMITAVIN